MNATAARLLLPVLLVAVCAATGFFELFSTFMDYDDEGWLMLANRLFLDGAIPYRDMPVLYGPMWLAVVELLHGVARVPVGHDAVRFVTLGWWLLLGASCGVLAHRLTASLAWGMTGFALAFGFAHSIVNEPGHPQALVATLTVLLPLAFRDGARTPWLACGAMVGAVFCIKYNAGAFCAAGVLGVLGCRLMTQRLRMAATTFIALLSLGAPFVLMLPMLGDPDCRGFAAIAGMSAAAVALQAAGREPHEASGVDLAMFLAGFSLVAGASFGFAAFHGAGPLTVISELLRYADGQRGFYHFFRTYSGVQIGMAVASLGMAVFAALADVRWRRVIAVVGRCALAGSAVLTLAVDDPAHAQAALGHVVPWCWVLALDPDGTPAGDARLMLAAVAAWTPLIAYPIPGSQLYFGMLPAMLAAFTGAADLATLELGGKAAMLPKLASGIALAVTVGVVGVRGYDAGQRYRRDEALDLPGARLLRLEARRVSNIRQLVDALRDADLVVSSFRFDSLVLWRDAALPAPQRFSIWPMRYYSAGEQAATVAALRDARSPRIVRRSGEPASPPGNAAATLMEKDFEPCARLGPYTVLKRRAVTS